MDDDKRQKRQEKRDLKRKGNRRLRRALKRQLEASPEDAPLARYEFSPFESTARLNEPGSRPKKAKPRRARVRDEEE